MSGRLRPVNPASAPLGFFFQRPEAETIFGKFGFKARDHHFRRLARQDPGKSSADVDGAFAGGARRLRRSEGGNQTTRPL